MNPASSTLPFEVDQAKASVERHRSLFVQVAQHAQVISTAAAVGALTANEALSAMRRHALQLVVALESMGRRAAS
jgi:hypothetical protein